MSGVQLDQLTQSTLLTLQQALHEGARQVVDAGRLCRCRCRCARVAQRYLKVLDLQGDGTPSWANRGEATCSPAACLIPAEVEDCKLEV
eukprot:CAMPEP_0174726068 /NCGR_PEP_ID=MMETSP1094-20130205/46970_1 /TAXON_ID=156173 /ORGANISM="Chrysochromulina brevifilum, Strain UTEX LB 985" /LENGTH=88 /DNA_ID=CAMNT_0015927579 /DNA_START=265 /DNA_END=528 /DNA_ORIENTATION=+